jgi:hypothetical protein
VSQTVVKPIITNISCQLSVASDVVGVSARDMLAAIVAGQSDVALLARGRMREKRAELERALEGRVRTHHRAEMALCNAEMMPCSVRHKHCNGGNAHVRQQLPVSKGEGMEGAECSRGHHFGDCRRVWLVAQQFGLS